MKKTVSLLLAAALLLAPLAACGSVEDRPTSPPESVSPSESASPSASAAPLESPPPSAGTSQSGSPAPTQAVSDIDAKLAELMDEALDYCAEQGEDVSQLERLDYRDPAALEHYVKDVYGVSDEIWDTCQSAVVAKGPEGSVFQAAIFRMGTDNPEEAGIELICALHTYLDGLEARNEDPALAELLHEVQAVYSMKYCFLVLSGCYEDVQGHVVLDLLNGGRFSSMARHLVPPESPIPTPAPTPDPDYPDRVLFTPPNQEDMSLYDTSAIRAAWEKGDPSALSDYDRAVYSAARQVLDGILTDGMRDLEKETAIYHWVVNSVDYDWTHQDVLAETPRSSYEPYGGLVDRKAVCLGYAVTFQLLCDLAGVECITVPGASSNSRGDHAWNMVRVDGKWYCVDVTWDSNKRQQTDQGEAKDWSYFNVTSDRMAETDHQWDYANTPEATA